jgi:hypothetical protein
LDQPAAIETGRRVTAVAIGLSEHPQSIVCRTAGHGAPDGGRLRLCGFGCSLNGVCRASSHQEEQRCKNDPIFRCRDHCGAPRAIDLSAKSKPANTMGFDFNEPVVYLSGPYLRTRIVRASSK